MLKEIKKTSKHTFVYALGNIITKLIGLILIPLYTDPQYLSHDDYGALAVLEATAQLLIGLLTMAMVGSLTRWYWDKEFQDRQKSIFFTTLSFLAIILVPVMGMLSFFTEDISGLLFGNINYSYLLKLTIFTAGFQILNNQVLCLAKLQSKSKMIALLQVSKFTIVFVLILYMILNRGMGLHAIWLANLIGEVFIFIILLPYAYKNVEFTFQKSILGEMLNYGLPLMLASVSGVLLAVTDRYMLSSMSGLEETGVYSVGFKIANTLKLVISTSLLLAISPLRMKKMNEPDNHRFYAKVLLYSGFVFIIGTLVLSLFSLEGLKVVTRSNIYWEANGIVPIISFSLLFGLLKDNVTVGLSIKKATKVVGTLIFLTGILNIGFNFLLIPIWDIYGAAFATLLSQLFLFVSMYIRAQKVYKIPYEIGKIVLMVLLAAVIVYIGVFISDLNVVLRLSIKIAMIILYPIALYFTGFFEQIEKEVIQKLFMQWRSPKALKESIMRLLKS